MDDHTRNCAQKLVVAVDASTPTGQSVRLWALQLGAQPIDEPRDGVLVLPTGPGTTREDIAAIIRPLLGKQVRPRTERFDDHGGTEAWPRGSY